MMIRPMVTFLAYSILLASCASFRESSKEDNKLANAQVGITPQISYENIAQLTQAWPEASRLAANNMITKYGLPAEVSRTQLIWYNTAPFKRTIVYRDEIAHNFPLPHTDVIEQVVDYRVPSSKVDELINFDGSIKVDRTRGELSSSNEKEEMNFLVINLADEIIRGEKTVEEAREAYSRLARAFDFGSTNQYINNLTFTPKNETADEDQSMMRDDQLNQTMQAEEAREIQEAQETLEESED
jgi:hypothetical protein